MKSTIHMMRISGIPIGFHWSWLAIFGLVTVPLATVHLPKALAVPAPALWALRC